MINFDVNVTMPVKENFTQAVATEIIHLRRKNKLTGKKLAQYVGVSQQQISRYESGKGNINVGTLAIILNVLNCPPERFFKNVTIRIKNNAL